MNPYPLIDIGVNLTNSRFAKDVDVILANGQAENVERLIVTGTSVEESHAALELAIQYNDHNSTGYDNYLCTTAGVHPHNASTWGIDSESEIRELLRHKAVVAVGECGLDFNRDFSPRDQQERCFAAQLEIAAEIAKPVFLHERDAHLRFTEIVKTYRDHLSGAVVHCFTGNKRELFNYLDLDCYIGITGWLCDERRADDLREAVRHAPLNRLMLETDAPYLTPRSIRPRPKRNEPAYLPYVLTELADRLKLPAEEVAAQTLANTKGFFNL